MTKEPRGLAALVIAVRDASRRRKLASLAIALAIEGLILLLLLTLGANIAGVEDGDQEAVTFKSVEFAAPPAPEQSEPAEPSEPETPQDSQPVTPAPAPPRPSPPPRACAKLPTPMYGCGTEAAISSSTR